MLAIVGVRDGIALSPTAGALRLLATSSVATPVDRRVRPAARVSVYRPGFAILKRAT